MEVEKKVRLWRAVKLPLIIVSSILLLMVIVIVSTLALRSHGIRKELNRSRHLLYSSSYSAYRDASSLVSKLYEKYPDRDDVIATYAWIKSYGGYLFGPEGKLLKESEKLISRMRKNNGGDELLWAAMALNLILSGKAKDALELINKKLRIYKNSTELKFLKGFALIKLDRQVEGRVELEMLRVKRDVFTPALLELAKLKFNKGDGAGAERVLEEILKKHSDSLSATVELAYILTKAGGKRVNSAWKLLSGVKEKNLPPALASKVYMVLGEIYIHKSDFSSAIKQLKRAYEISPHNWEVVYNFLYACRKGGALVEAEKVIKDIQLTEATPGNVLMEISRIHLALYRTTDAVRALELIAPETEEEMRAYNYLKGIYHLQMGDEESSIEFFDKANGYLDASLLRSIAMVEVGKRRKAIRYLRDLKNSSGDPCFRGVYDWVRGKVKDKDLLVEKLSSCPFNVKVDILLKSRVYDETYKMLKVKAASYESPWIQLQLTKASMRSAGKKIAIEELSKVNRFSPQSIALLTEVVRLYLKLRVMDEAERIANEITQLNPSVADGYGLLAEVKIQSGKIGEAGATIESAVKNFPHNEYLALVRAMFLEKKGDYEGARNIASNLIGRLDNPYLVTLCARVLFRAEKSLGDLKSADSALLDSAKRLERNFHPSYATQLYADVVSLRRATGGKKNLAKALGIFRYASSRPFPSPSVFYEGGLLYYQQGKTDKAVSNLQKAILVDPFFEPAYFELNKMGQINQVARVKYLQIFGRGIK